MTDQRLSPETAVIVERLRNFRIWNHAHSHYDPVPLCQEAADLIERLRAHAQCVPSTDWPPQFEPMKLQARSKGSEWTDIFPAQLEAMARYGHEVRAIEPPSALTSTPSAAPSQSPWRPIDTAPKDGT